MSPEQSVYDKSAEQQDEYAKQQGNLSLLDTANCVTSENSRCSMKTFSATIHTHTHSVASIFNVHDLSGNKKWCINSKFNGDKWHKVLW